MKRSREAYEFSKGVKHEALQRCGNKCERCGKHKKEVGKLYAHHKLAISIAIHYYPEISASVIKSLANCEILCDSCHKKADIQARKEHEKYALTLRVMEKFATAG